LLAATGLLACDRKQQAQTTPVEPEKTAAPDPAKTEPAKVVDVNPFLQAVWATPNEFPPFDQIKSSHYMPAFEKGMKDQKDAIAKITASKEPPTFENTIEPLEYSSETLDRVANVFFLIAGADLNDELQKIQQDITPILTRHSDDILLDAKLFERIKTLATARVNWAGTVEQRTVLDKHYKRFVRGGALLSPDDQKKLRAINEELANLSLKYNENLLAEVKRFELVLTTEAELEGLPASVRAAALATGKARGKEGKWVFTLDKPSWIPFLQYSKRRDLREKLYLGYINKGDHNDDLDNKKLIARVAALRVAQAKLLGFKNYADFALDIQMAKDSAGVYKLLDQLWKAALPNGKKEAAALQKMIDKEKGGFKLASWDWWYYAEKLRKEKYDLDEEAMRPYFQLENVINGVFGVAGRLYGLKFVEQKDYPKYNAEARTYEVQNADGTLLGLLVADFHPRPGKRGGAWMGEYRQQKRKGGKMIHPIVTIVCNFTRPTGDTPALLSFEEVSTLFHEFGHALHGLLSDCTYPIVAGTNVPTDFVELPSQVMEHWASEPEVLKTFAKHWKTGEVIPAALVEKMTKSQLFNQGFETVEYLAASMLDMAWHTLTDPKELDAAAFEKQTLGKLGLIPEIISRYRSTYFSHVVGGYAAGYYSYIWAAVLDNDAFEAFREAKNIFDPATAAKFRKLLSSGHTQEPMALYRAFRGREPKIEPLLKQRGLK
jgi:peptidyl-dipeptidase Dcp